MNGEKPLIVISHNSEDAEIAGKFCELIESASGDLLETFNSSDIVNKTKIWYGEGLVQDVSG